MCFPYILVANTIGRKYLFFSNLGPVVGSLQINQQSTDDSRRKDQIYFFFVQAFFLGQRIWTLQEFSIILYDLFDMRKGKFFSTLEFLVDLKINWQRQINMQIISFM